MREVRWLGVVLWLSAAAQVASASQPGPTDGGAPAVLEPAGAVNAGGAPEVEALPISGGAPALCDELRRAASSRASSRLRLEAERKALAAEREKLEALAAEVARARDALRAETQRLEGLLGVGSSPGATPGLPPQGEPGRSENLARLAKALKAMKGPQAAALVTRVDARLAAQVLQQMSPRDSGAVLASLKPELAAELLTTMARLPPAVKQGRRP